MAIQIVTDSTCDLSQETIRELGLHIVPLKLRFGTDEYIEGVDITPEQFYAKLASSAQLPSTSQAAPGDFESILRPILERGDEAVILPLSSAISGTYQSAAMAKRNLKSDHIHLIDTQTTTIGLGDLVRKASALAADGAAAKELVAIISNYASRLHITAIIDTLKYLHKGGRLSAMSSVVGGMLNIKPIIALVEGRVELVGRARGIKGACEWIGKKYESAKVDRSLGTTFAYTANSEHMNELISVCQRHGVGSYSIGQVGAVIGTHTGPGCAAFGYYTK